MDEEEPRLVALDLHKAYVLVEAVDTRQEVVLHPRRVPLPQFDGWARKHLRSTDTVVVEATSNAWTIYDRLQPLVARVVVADTHRLKLITNAPVRTDKRATQALAGLLAAGMIPEVWVPPVPVRELRALVQHRQRLVAQTTAAQNRLHSLLHRHQIVPPDGGLTAPSNRAWWDTLPLSSTEKLCAGQDLLVVEQVGTLVQQAEEELARLSIRPPWDRQTAFLVQLPGIGLLTAMTILGAIGDIARFPSARHLVGYAGLGTYIHDSGQTHHAGGITKQGRRELRTAVVEAAWITVRTHRYWREKFAALEPRLGKQKTIVAIGRRLLVVIWYVLTAQAADRQADPEAVARSLLTWAARHRLATSQGLSRPEFVRQELDRLGLGAELDHFQYGSQRCQLPPSALTLDLPGDLLASLAIPAEEVTT